MISHFLQKLLIEIATIPPSSSAGSEETGREQCYRQYPSVSFLLSLTGIHTALSKETRAGPVLVAPENHPRHVGGQVGKKSQQGKSQQGGVMVWTSL